MTTLTFQGYSDDTFACTGAGIDVDCDNCASGDPIMMKVTAGDAGMIVGGQYALGACAGWLIGIAPIEGADLDGQHTPHWPMQFVRTDRGYSPALIVEAPDGVSVTLLPE